MRTLNISSPTGGIFCLSLILALCVCVAAHIFQDALAVAAAISGGFIAVGAVLAKGGQLGRHIGAATALIGQAIA